MTCQPVDPVLPFYVCQTPADVQDALDHGVWEQVSEVWTSHATRLPGTMVSAPMAVLTLSVDEGGFYDTDVPRYSTREVWATCWSHPVTGEVRHRLSTDDGQPMAASVWREGNFPLLVAAHPHLEACLAFFTAADAEEA